VCRSPASQRHTGVPATESTNHGKSFHLTDDGHQGWSWTSLADGLGSSLELINPNLPNDFEGHVTGADAQAMLIALTDLRSIQSAHTLTDADLQALHSTLISGGGSGIATQPDAQASAAEIPAPPNQLPPTSSHHNSIANILAFVEPAPEINATPNWQEPSPIAAPTGAWLGRQPAVESRDRFFAFLARKGTIAASRKPLGLTSAATEENELDELLSAALDPNRGDF
jgi:hypothetical protein